MRAKLLLITTLLIAVTQVAFAEGAVKAADATPIEWPPYVALMKSVELPAMTESGQMRMAKVPQGTMVQVIKVDGDRVEVLHQNLTIRLPAVMTDLSIRMQARKQMAAAGQGFSAPPAPPAQATPAATAPPSQPSQDTKTFIEGSMSGETFKAVGLDKLSPAELQLLDKWFMDIVLASKRGAVLSQPSDPMLAASGKKAGSVERALLVKNFNGDKVLVQRTNGEKWMLKAKTWCRWSWRYEGRYVCLVFGATTSQLINDYGESYDFWTEKQIE
ncbi:MAG: hypothetical protein NTY01_21960 [Verrucomicrobia bacterium]|nr:hypothetical protein [Verrucomicrobiota bacterium]